MAKLGSMITPGKSTQRIEANNQVFLNPGTYFGSIVDVWIYNVDGDGKFTREHTGEQKVSLKIAIDGTDIVLDKRMRAYLSPKSHFAKLIGSLTGIEPGSAAMSEYDADGLKGMRVTVLTSHNALYTNIDSILPAPSSPQPIAQAPADDRITPEAEAKIRELIDEHHLTTMQVADVVIHVTTGGTNDYRSASLSEAREIYQRLKKLAGGAPF